MEVEVEKRQHCIIRDLDLGCISDSFGWAFVYFFEFDLASRR